MFTRNNIIRNPTDQINILGGKQNFAFNPQIPSFISNTNETIDSDLQEKQGNYGRVNPVSHSTKQINTRVNNEHTPNQSQLDINTTSASDNVFKTQTIPVTNNSNLSYISRQPTVSSSTNIPKSFVSANQTLTPIRAENGYLVTSSNSRTNMVINQNSQANAYFGRHESVSSNSVYANRTPLNITNVDSHYQPYQYSINTGNGLVNFNHMEEVPKVNESEKVQQDVYTTKFHSQNQSYSQNQSQGHNQIQNGRLAGGQIVQPHLIKTAIQQYGSITNIPGLRKIDPPLGTSDSKSASNYVQPANVNNVKRQIFATQAPDQDFLNQVNQQDLTPRAASRLNLPTIQSMQSIQTAINSSDNQINNIRGSVRNPDTNEYDSQSKDSYNPLQNPIPSNEQPTHRSNHSQTNIVVSSSTVRPTKTQAQRMSLNNDNFLDTKVIDVTPNRAALRKQSQPSTINLTFHDTGRLNPEYAEVQEMVNTDRKKEWKPLIPENELLNNQVQGKVTISPINYTAEVQRNITPPPPQRSNYPSSNSRPLSKAQNVQSMGRFDNGSDLEQAEKINSLENELAKLKVVVDNLQKEKDLALRFNELLLVKLNGVGAIEAGSVVLVE